MYMDRDRIKRRIAYFLGDEFEIYNSLDAADGVLKIIDEESEKHWNRCLEDLLKDCQFEI